MKLYNFFKNKNDDSISTDDYLTDKRNNDKVKEIIKKVREIEIKVKNSVSEKLSGEYQSCFKGGGIDFDDFREYQHGDDVRNIDWNVTARMDHPYIRKFTENRELTVILCIDISKSHNYGSVDISKREYMSEIAALISYSALKNKDNIGLILFDEGVEFYLPAKKGNSHILRIIRETLFFNKNNKLNSFASALNFLKNSINKHSLIFYISDFISEINLKKDLSSLNKKHDLIAIQVMDPVEENLPNVGKVCLEDIETNMQVVINTSNKSLRDNYKKKRELWQSNLDSSFVKSGIEKITLNTSQDYVLALHKFFKNRAFGS